MDLLYRYAENSELKEIVQVKHFFFLLFGSFICKNVVNFDIFPHIAFFIAHAIENFNLRFLKHLYKKKMLC